jgi:hypothetical protein
VDYDRHEGFFLEAYDDGTPASPHVPRGQERGPMQTRCWGHSFGRRLGDRRAHPSSRSAHQAHSAQACCVRCSRPAAAFGFATTTRARFCSGTTFFLSAAARICSAHLHRYEYRRTSAMVCDWRSAWAARTRSPASGGAAVRPNPRFFSGTASEFCCRYRWQSGYCRVLSGYCRVLSGYCRVLSGQSGYCASELRSGVV